MAIEENIDNEALMKTLNEAISNESVPKIYANGFVTAIGHGDVMILLQRNNQPSAVLNLSFSVAKTLALSLGKTIRDLETKTDEEIMTTSDIQKALQKDEKNG